MMRTVEGLGGAFLLLLHLFLHHRCSHRAVNAVEGHSPGLSILMECHPRVGHSLVN